MPVAAGCSNAPQGGDIAAAVKATSPLAYYRLDSTSGKSETGSSTYQFSGGTTNDSPGPVAGPAGNRFAMLNGKDDWVKTTQTGGIGNTASIMAWVNLEKLPKEEDLILYVAGESQMATISTCNSNRTTRSNSSPAAVQSLTTLRTRPHSQSTGT
jgi:hypothetical protein